METMETDSIGRNVVKREIHCESVDLEPTSLNKCNISEDGRSIKNMK